MKLDADSETLIEKIEKELTKKPIVDEIKYLFKSNYRTEKRAKKIIFNLETYQIITDSKIYNKVLLEWRKYFEEEWNEGFSTINYKEEPIKHHVEMHKRLQEIINIPELKNDKIKGTYLEDKIVLTKIPPDMKDATDYAKEMPKTLTKIIAEYLGKIHSSNIAYKDPSLYSVTISPTRKIISFNNLIYAQTTDRMEDKARDIMQFIISIHYNSGKPIDELTEIFKINYKKYHNNINMIKNAMKNIIKYDIDKIRMSPTKEIYHLMVYGFSQNKTLNLKKIIEKTF